MIVYAVPFAAVMLCAAILRMARRPNVRVYPGPNGIPAVIETPDYRYVNNGGTVVAERLVDGKLTHVSGMVAAAPGAPHLVMPEDLPPPPLADGLRKYNHEGIEMINLPTDRGGEGSHWVAAENYDYVVKALQRAERERNESRAQLARAAASAAKNRGQVPHRVKMATEIMRERET